MEMYGIGEGDYDRMYAAQGGKCAICQRGKGKSKRLSVDHDHKTGKVRGLLCAACNRWLLGRCARDDVAVLQRAIEYLEHPPAQEVLRHEDDCDGTG